MYKCVGADGKISFSTVPCQGDSKTAREMVVRPPEPDAARDQRREAESARLARENAAFQRRDAARQRQLDDDAEQYAARAAVRKRLEREEAQWKKRHQEQNERDSINRDRIERLNECHSGRREFC
ncbi:DUF4124 domain-containing protein [Massilia sp. H-1]|nr:DUF4124 domain-containing protein [Massilia sp. H-1]